jgi:hypothetical protein
MLGIGCVAGVVIDVDGFVRHNKTHGRTFTICLISGHVDTVVSEFSPVKLIPV